MSNQPTTMLARVERYLSTRRKLGYELRVEGKELIRFAHYADSHGHRGPVNTKVALNWASSAQGCTRRYQARRLESVRCLARYLAVFEPHTEIPPKGLLGPAHRRIQPHIYTPQEVAALLRAAATLQPREGIRPRTYVTLLGLVACTGLRLCEALRLDRQDVDIAEGILTVRKSKFRKSRLVPLHPTASCALQEYATFRDRYLPGVGCTRFLLSQRGTALMPSVVHWTFCGLRQKAGLESSGQQRAPRIYDLRHTFACRRLLEWYREGRDVNHLVPSLATYLGHVKVTDTYWYLTGVPELMSIAGRRFEQFACSTAGGIL
jgi:integrase